MTELDPEVGAILVRRGLDPLATLPSAPGFPRWWANHDRLHLAEDGIPRDLGSLLPILVRRLRDRSPMVLVPRGVFRAGAPAPSPGEPPEHWAETDAFWIDRYPVTVAGYREFLAATGHAEVPDLWEQQLRRPRRPVVFVDWFDAVAYSGWAGGRLPTEAEWEKAARGCDGPAVPWGDPSAPDPAYGNFNFDYSRHVGDWDRWLEEVGSHPLGDSPFGMGDPIGNVWEWCLERFDPAAPPRMRSPDPGPRSGRPVDAGERSVRGGSWHEMGPRLRTSYRGHQGSLTRADQLGFRLVVPASGPEDDRGPEGLAAGTRVVW